MNLDDLQRNSLTGERTENFKFYPPLVTRLIAIEPNMEMYPMIELSKSSLSSNVELIVTPGIAQELSHIKDGSVDAVVAFHVLCTVSNITEALLEARRILKGKAERLLHSASVLTIS